jgi:hypothetical protein
MPYIDPQVQQNTGDLKRFAEQNSKPAEPDEHWSMELEKRAKEASIQVEMHQRELERWQRMSRATHAALAALHEPRQDPGYDQPEQSEY